MVIPQEQVQKLENVGQEVASKLTSGKNKVEYYKNLFRKAEAHHIPTYMQGPRDKVLLFGIGIAFSAAMVAISYSAWHLAHGTGKKKE